MPILTLRDAATGATARILPEIGFNCFAFQAPVAGHIVDVLDADPAFAAGAAKPSGSGIPLLFPFPNRIRGGRFQWAGVDYQLPRNNAQGHAIHGFVFDRPWRVTEQEPCSATGEFQLSLDAPDRRKLWPADFLIAVTYTLRGPALRCDVRIANPGSEPLPWGLGMHPYFCTPLAPTSRREECLIQAPAGELRELVENLPTGRRLPIPPALDLREGVPLGGLKLDDAYTAMRVVGGQIQSLVMDAPAGLQVTQTTDAAFREFIAFTPPHGRSVCLEPYTCTTDAVNLAALGIDSGWRVLASGEEFQTWFELRAGLIVA